MSIVRILMDVYTLIKAVRDFVSKRTLSDTEREMLSIIRSEINIILNENERREDVE